MAGDNQHFIPQFIQRGFASHWKEKNAYAWEFRRGEEPQNKAVRTIGSSSLFYATESDCSIDEAITEKEPKFAKFLHRLRDGDVGPIKDSRLAQFLAHFEVRTNNLRSSFIQTSAELVDCLADLIEHGDQFADLVLARLRNDPRILERLIEEELRKQPLPSAILKARTREALKAATKNLPKQRPILITHAAMMAKLLRTQKNVPLEQAAKKGHMKALSQSIAPEVRIRALEVFNYRILEVPTQDMILGDSAVVLQEKVSKRFRSISEKDTEYSLVVLPISKSRILIGEKESETAYDIQVLKRQIARCSFDFFIAHQDSQENRMLQTEIRTDAMRLTKEEIEDTAIQSFLKSFEGDFLSTQ